MAPSCRSARARSSTAGSGGPSGGSAWTAVDVIGAVAGILVVLFGLLMMVAGELATVPAAVAQRDQGRGRSNSRAADRDLEALSTRNLLAAKREDLTPAAGVDDDAASDPGADRPVGQLPPDDELGECSLPGELVAIIAAEDPAWSIVLYAGRGDELRALLLEFDWLQAKLEAAGINALLADFDVALAADQAPSV